jgi:hypothetical protein
LTRQTTIKGGYSNSIGRRAAAIVKGGHSNSRAIATVMPQSNPPLEEERE